MQPQGLHSPTFHLPDTILSATANNADIPLPALWDWHLEHSPDHPIFVYYDEDDGGKGVVRTITWGEGVRAIHNAARFVEATAVRHGIVNDPNSTAPVVVGILGVLNTLTYWAILTGTMRAGYHAFVISPRNSPAALAHLLAISHCQLLFVSDDSSTQELYREALALALRESQPVNLEGKSMNLKDIVFVDTPQHYEFFKEDKEKEGFVPLEPFRVGDLDVPSLTLHSSGSTSFPKPIPLTHRTLFRMAASRYYGKTDACGVISSTHAIPLFHAMGILATIAHSSTCGTICSIMKPRNPPSVPTPDVMLDQAVATRCDSLVVVPSLLEEWSHSPEAVEKLKTFNSVVFGGGPLAPVTGDWLVKQGVKVRTGYGSTEAGALTQFTNDDLGEDWAYFKENTQLKIYWKPHGDNQFEPIILSSPTFAPAVFNTVVDGVPAFAMNDLCVPHPTRKGYWLVYGRVDDQIMHSNGEKTNPGPLETIIANHPDIQACVMFGRARFQAGILIEPVEEKRFDPSDEGRLAAFRNEIWPQIEKANEYAPSHSRLFKEMVIFTTPFTPFPYTGKGTVQRQAVLRLYDAEIAAAYLAVQNSTTSDVTPPESWDPESAVGFVRELVRRLVPRSIGDEADLFQSGGDSLQATNLRISITQAFRDTKQDPSGITQNIVYTHPTIKSLGNFISSLATGKTDTHVNGTTTSITDVMEAMVAEYTQAFPKHVPSKPAPESECILLTGTTGSLGTCILVKLLAMPSVRRVYALNRPGKSSNAGKGTGTGTLRDRQVKAFENQGMDGALVDSPKLVLLEGDTGEADLKLGKERVEEMVGCLTGIIHNAWRVDFNVPLSSFKSLVGGVRNLVNVALASPFPSPPPIIFTSSVGVIAGWSESRPVPEAPILDPKIAAAGGGYAQSKWAAERILDIANREASMKNVVVRVGQLCGSRVKGSWNQWEWFPAIVQSSKLVHCLPSAAGLVTWIPVDVAAAAIIDMRTSPASYLHLVHPKPVAWSSIIQPIAHALNVPVVSYQEWLEKLEAVVKKTEETTSNASQLEAARENPALRLIDFYRRAGHGHARKDTGGQGSEAEAFTRERLDLTVTKSVMETLRDPELAPLSEDDTMKWLAHWRDIGVL